MNSKYLEYLFPILFTILTALSTLLALYIKLLSKKIEKQIKKLDDDDTRALADNIRQRAEQCINDAVVYTNQTLVENLKQASSDGKLTDEEMKLALTTAYNKTVELMGRELHLQLAETVPDIQNWIETKIEKFVNQNK